MSKFKMILNVLIIIIGFIGTVIITTFSVVGLLIAVVLGAIWRR